MTDMIYVCPQAALNILMDGGIGKDEAIAHMVRMKNEYDLECVQSFDKTIYFNPKALNAICKTAHNPRPTP